MAGEIKYLQSIQFSAWYIENAQEIVAILIFTHSTFNLLNEGKLSTSRKINVWSLFWDHSQSRGEEREIVQ